MVTKKLETKYVVNVDTTDIKEEITLLNYTADVGDIVEFVRDVDPNSTPDEIGQAISWGIGWGGEYQHGVPMDPNDKPYEILAMDSKMKLKILKGTTDINVVYRVGVNVWCDYKKPGETEYTRTSYSLNIN